MNNNNLIIVFTRNPELGKVKTRLAKTIGNHAALDIYKYLLSHTYNTIKDIECDKAIYYSQDIIENDLWSGLNFKKYLQKGNDLGERIQQAFEAAFKDKYNQVIVIGSDLLDLTPEHINKAFKALEQHDIVIGPAMDGGYYLLGMKQLHSNIFNQKAWGTSSVLQDTLNDLRHTKHYMLEELNDIDTFEDLKEYKLLKHFFLQND